MMSLLSGVLFWVLLAQVRPVNGKGPSNNIAYSPNMRRGKVSNANSSEIDGNKGNIP